VREHVSFFSAYLLTKCLSIYIYSLLLFAIDKSSRKWVKETNECVSIYFLTLKKLGIADIDAGGSGKLNSWINILLVQVFRMVRSFVRILFKNFVDITHLSSEDWWWWWWWWYLPLPSSVISHTINELLLISDSLWFVFYLELSSSLLFISKKLDSIYFV
jgi:hypothetical protein